eukprot:m.54563 g.54563  ORF g.54563 m.54563 type:complete len:1516 (+) comp6603_c0_seq1:24-4571(+)
MLALLRAARRLSSSAGSVRAAPEPIRTVLQVSDIHVRAGDSAASRAAEYREQLARLVRALHAYDPASTLVVLLGDVFHDKSRLGPCGQMLAQELFDGLRDMRTIVIRGNHDYRQDQPDEPSLLQPYFSGSAHFTTADNTFGGIEVAPDSRSLLAPGIRLLDATGLYRVGNIELGLVSVQDTLVRGAAGGIVGQLPPFPRPSPQSAQGITHRIALFHGSFGGSLLQNGTDADTRTNYPIEWIQGYDMMLFGDIHVQQVHGMDRARFAPALHGPASSAAPLATPSGEQDEMFSTVRKDIYSAGTYTWRADRTPWAYAGSTLQQNFGESMWGHGFIAWDLQAGTATSWHLRSDHGLAVVALDADGRPCVKVRQGKAQHMLPIAQATALGWFPRDLSVRYTTSVRDQIEPIRTQLEAAGVAVRETGFVEETAMEDVSTAVVNHEMRAEIAQDLSTLTSPENWIKFIAENASLPPGDWASLIRTPELLHAHSDLLASLPELTDKLQVRSRGFQKAIDEYTLARDHVAAVKLLRIHYIEFGNILCFGRENWIDFDQFRKSVCLLSGNNGSGKSATLEALCLALFGESLPSRASKAYSASIINQRKAAMDPAYTRILISINGKRYWIGRSFAPADANPRKLETGARLVDYDTSEVLKQNANVVDPWVAENLGRFRHFLLTSMMSQANDSDFFVMAAKDQRAIIDSLLHLDVVDGFKSLLKDARLNHAYIIGHLDTYAASLAAQTTAAHVPPSLSASASASESESVSSSSERGVAPFDLGAVEARVSELTAERERAQLIVTDSRRMLSHIPANVFETPIQEYHGSRAAAEAYLSRQTKRDLPSLRAEQLKLQSSTTKALSVKASLERLATDAGISLSSVQRVSPPVQVEGVGSDDLDGISNQAVACCMQLRALPAGLEPYNESEHQAWLAAGQDVASKGGLGPAAQSFTALAEKVLATVTQTAIVRTFLQAELARARAPSLQELQALDQLNASRSDLVDLGRAASGLTTANDAISQLQDSSLVDYLIAVDDQLRKLQKWLSVMRSVPGLPSTAVVDVDAMADKIRELQVRNPVLAEQRSALQLCHAPDARATGQVPYRAAVIRSLLDAQPTSTELTSLTDALSKLAVEERMWQARHQRSTVEQQAAALISAGIHQCDTEIQHAANTSKQLHTQIAEAEQYAARHSELQLIDQYIELYPMHTRLTAATKQLESIDAQLQPLRWHLEQTRALSSKRDAILHERAGLQQRLDLLSGLAAALDTYSDWLYPTRVGPAIEGAVNSVLASIALPRPIRIKAEWAEGQFNWFVQDGVSTPPYEKCSGSQRFFVSLALRFAFGRMGVANMLSAQIFLDEGFTACDAETLERVPALLGNLIRELDYLESIFIVSHLDALKTAATRTITVSRGANSSQLTVGTRRLVPIVATATMPRRTSSRLKAAPAGTAQLSSAVIDELSSDVGTIDSAVDVVTTPVRKPRKTAVKKAAAPSSFLDELVDLVAVKGSKTAQLEPVTTAPPKAARKSKKASK